MFRNLYYRIMSYLPPMALLTIISAIFYTVLQYYATTALNDAANSSQEIQLLIAERVFNLRMWLSVAFCFLFGYMGVKMTGHIWPAMIVHIVVVFLLLLVDIPWEQMWEYWKITLGILGTVAALTGVSGAITLFSIWIKMKYPRYRKK